MTIVPENKSSRVGNYEWHKAWVESDLPTPARNLAAHIALFMDKHGMTFVGEEKLAKSMGLSVRQVQRSMSVLVEAGWIARTDRPGDKTTLTYARLPEATLVTEGRHVGRGEATLVTGRGDTSVVLSTCEGPDKGQNREERAGASRAEPASAPRVKKVTCAICLGEAGDSGLRDDIYEATPGYFRPAHEACMSLLDEDDEPEVSLAPVEAAQRPVDPDEAVMEDEDEDEVPKYRPLPLAAPTRPLATVSLMHGIDDLDDFQAELEYWNREETKALVA